MEEKQTEDRLFGVTPEVREKIGDLYQKITKYRRDSMMGGGLDWGNKPETYKVYQHPLSVIDLPHPDKEGGEKLFTVIQGRRSIRDYSQKPISLENLSQLLWASQGITADIQGYGLRAAPSAGALYPIETYLVINNGGSIDRGIYHYRTINHQLEFIKSGDFRKEIARAALEQAIAAYAAVVFVWTAVVDRSRWKYRQRGYRYMYLDAGHIAGNLALTAESLGLGSCNIGALFDDDVNELLGIDGEKETVLYLATIGHTLSEKKI